MKLNALTRLVASSVCLAILFSSCSASDDATTVTTTTTKPTTTTNKPTTTVDSGADYYMICDPGSCTTMDETYLGIVRRALPPLYINQLSDNNLFTMATNWCRTINEAGGWEKIKTFIQDAYDKGVRNDYNLYVWTLLGSASYCYDKQEEIAAYVGNLRQL